MDGLIELLIQIFGEALVEIFVHFFAWIISVVVTDFDNDPKKRKILKTVIYIICLIACIVLLVLSFIYAKTAYAWLVTIFLAVNIFILGMKLINKTYINGNKYISVSAIILTRIARITYYVLMFVFLNTLETNTSKAVIISVSSALMLAFICIDIYRFKKYLDNKKLDNQTIY